MKVTLLAILAACSLAPLAAEESIDKKIEIYGDFRARLESDFDSRRGDGSPRDDRDRMRARLRVGIDAKAGEHVTIGARLISGSDADHQSPHITLLDFDDNDTGDADFNLDRWFVRASKDRLWGWAGRNTFPFWKQNEFFWDDDATSAGIAGGVETRAGEKGALAFNAAVLSPPVGMRAFAGRLTGVQAVWKGDAGAAHMTAALGLFDYSPADASADPDALTLLNGNGLREYRPIVANVQVRWDAGGRPLVLGADAIHNAQHYAATDPDPFTVAHRDETDGFSLSVAYGDARKWQAAWVWARIETLAVIASYAQDDWVRWGSSSETTGTDLEGHEFRFVRGLGDASNLTARLYLVEAITSVQDGRRFRLDYNLRF